VPTMLDELALQHALARHLAGSGAGSSGPSAGVGPEASSPVPPAVVWVDGGDEVVVWLSSLRVRLAPGVIRMTVELEAEEIGRHPQEAVVAVAGRGAPASLLAVAGESTEGESRLAARWGRALQDALWGGVLAAAGAETRGIASDDGELVLDRQTTG
jgi:hypothetical protein